MVNSVLVTTNCCWRVECCFPPSGLEELDSIRFDSNQFGWKKVGRPRRGAARADEEEENGFSNRARKVEIEVGEKVSSERTVFVYQRGRTIRTITIGRMSHFVEFDERRETSLL